MRPESLRRHVREEHEGKGPVKSQIKDNTCPICKEAFERRYLLNIHMKKTHNTTVAAYENLPQNHACEYCGKVSLHISYLGYRLS